ncbi:orotidine-5'-phosphate decarboxylase [Actinoalloteichus hymeniacidonis]|uniref:Orotidine 5'-phosphate decarboxylase n=1 Tax=Actinoalloteichus hymeniacidonis TaxID=340345 RepID=A0AAC9HPL3_9PSEU|nr:orotidine-5'-phosphate decarboxylase [Actinoalloteichus hymeniacidonis]AOS63115.1 orotidine-5'-phosphate decarboxylase [Actinoalloteichus hymeniacidonis]MBB5908849.1 orotidine-5'-phosphate decarboxylase [Actinoalloteichus hymeniacidonis]
MITTFGARLSAAMDARGPLCVGVDPHPALLTAWGLTDDLTGLRRFAEICVEALADEVAMLKPQSAFFESHGSGGIAVLEQLIADARARGTLVLVDAKRGDIGSTMTAYAKAYLTEGSALAGDAVTLSPYLGFDSLAPAFEAASASGRGVFVLARTSNPEGSSVQDAVASKADGERSVAQGMVDAAAQLNVGAPRLGAVGLVVGGNLPTLNLDLSGLNGPILAPGFGAQGGTVADLRRLFGPNLEGVLPTSSRDVLRHGPDAEALRAAVRELRARLTEPAA